MYKEEIWGIHDEYPMYKISSYGDKVFSMYTNKYLKFHKNNSGYSRVNINNKFGIHKSVFVHKLILEIFDKPRPKFAIARHYPDQNVTNNNIENLSWSNQQQNNWDRIENGTYNQAILDPDEIILIKELLINGATHIDIQETVNKQISAAVISNIRHGNIWKNIGPDISNYEFRKGGGQKLTIDQVKQIKRLLLTKQSQSSIAKQFGIHQSAVSNINRRKSYSDVKI